jgi:hypothetical protein
VLSSAPPNVHMFCPLGVDLTNSDRDEDDVDDTAEDYGEESVGSVMDASTSSYASDPAFENAISEEHAIKHKPFFEMNGERIWKGRYLNAEFRNYKNPQAGS